MGSHQTNDRYLSQGETFVRSKDANQVSALQEDDARSSDSINENVQHGEHRGEDVSDTPRTDEIVERLYGPLSDRFETSLAGRFAKFARTLERENTALREQLRLAQEQLKEANIKIESLLDNRDDDRD
jgi:hypothetical protein